MLNLEYSPKERFNKIVDIVADGVIRLIQYNAKFFQDMRNRLAEDLSRMSKDKSIKSCSISSSILWADIPKGMKKRDFYYRELSGKVRSLTQTISRD